MIREIGRKGEGPGEFKSASVAGVMDDGDLWVIDYGLRRITFFDFLPDYLTPIDEVVASESSEFIFEQSGHENRWLRFRPEEGLAGRIDFPDGFQPMVVKGNKVAGRQVDEFGVHALVVLHALWG